MVTEEEKNEEEEQEYLRVQQPTRNKEAQSTMPPETKVHT